MSQPLKPIIGKYLKIRHKLHKDIYKMLGMNERTYFRKIKADTFTEEERKQILMYLKVKE